MSDRHVNATRTWYTRNATEAIATHLGLHLNDDGKPTEPGTPGTSRECSAHDAAGGVEAGLRGALAELADDRDAMCRSCARDLRAVLAVHPAPETNEDCGHCLGTSVETCMTHPAPVSATGHGEEWVEVAGRAALDSLPFDNPTISYRESGMIRAAVRAVLAALPATPVVTATDDELLALYSSANTPPSHPAESDEPLIRFGRAVLAAHAVPAPPVVDEAGALAVPPDGVKMLREALARAQAALARRPMNSSVRADIDRLGHLILQCDAHRPLGPDGKHGDRHTATCGCDGHELQTT